MTPSDIPHLAMHLMEKHGIAQTGWTFKWDNAKLRAGQCRYYRKTISLSRHYVTHNVTERLDDIIDTILHEIAHAIVGLNKGHGPEWKEAATRIGAKPERCYDSTAISMPRGRFVATCGGCRREFTRHKQPRKNRTIYCTTCGKERGVLQYIDTTATTTQPPPSKDTLPTPKRLRG